MQVTPASGPMGIALPPTNSNGDSKMQAIKANLQSLMDTGGNAPELTNPGVKNPSRVAPEEMSALRQGNPDIRTNNESKSTEAPKSSEDKVSEDPISSQYAALARREKAMRARANAEQAQAKAKEAALLAREEAIKAKEAEYTQNYIPKDRFSADPLTALQEAGLSYEQLTELMLNNSAPQDARLVSQINQLKAELESIRNDSKSTKQAMETQQTDAYNQAINQIKIEARSLVKNDPSFETIRETGSVSEVVELIEKTFKEDGILLSVEEAAQEVETELTERMFNYSNRIKKIKDRLEAKNSGGSESQKLPDSQEKSQLKTLTNSVSTSRQLSARERAILAAKGQL